MKRQLIKTGITVTLPIVILIVLFALQDTFIRLGSTRMSRMQNETTAASIADSIQILYNYKNRCDTGLQYRSDGLYKLPENGTCHGRYPNNIRQKG